MATLRTLMILAALATVSNTMPNFEDWFRFPFDVTKDILNKGIELNRQVWNFTVDKASQIGTRVINTRQNIAKKAIDIASKTADEATLGAAAFAGVFDDLTANSSLLGSVVKTGAKFAGTSVRAWNAGVQTGLATLGAVDEAILTGINKTITSAADLAGNTINSVAQMRKGFVDAGLDFAGAGAGLVGSGIDKSLNSVKSGVIKVGDWVDAVRKLTDTVASDAMNSMKKNNTL